jgi:hypothetical protein
MTQVARPTADDRVGGWTPTPLYQRINGVTANDAAPVASGSNPQGDAFEVKLAALAAPGPGAETLTVRMAGDGSTPATVALLQGGTAIASARFMPTASFQDYTLTLSAAQSSQITDYTNLHVEVIAGDVKVTCCPNALPPLLQATFSGGTGGCSCLNGVTVALGWDGATYWSGSFTACGLVLVLGLTCPSGGQWALSGTVSPCILLFGPVGPTSSSCAPFALTFSGLSGTCCSGTFTVTVTP